MTRLGFSDRLMMIFIYVFLIVLSFSAFYPFWNALVVSFNLGIDTSKGGVTFWPRVFTWENYQIVFQDDRLINGFFVSVSRTIVGTVTSILMTAILAYGMTKRQLIGRNYFMVFFVITMYFSGGLIPSYLLTSSLGLMNKFMVYIIPGLVGVWNMIIFRTFFRGLPVGLEESAQIDGATNWGILFRIIFPLSGPVIATLSLFTAVAHWNDWFVASIYITNEKLVPIQTMLKQILNANIVTELSNSIDSASAVHLDRMKTITTRSLTMAIMMVATLPIIAVYPFVQKYFVKGVLIGSLKE